MYKNQKGFTLLELLMVIAIIGILAAVIFAAVNSSRSQTRDTQRLSEVNSVIKALELYYNDNGGTYPTSNAYIGGILVTNKYLPTLPKDPSTGADYFYRGQGAGANLPCTGFMIGTTLENSNNQALRYDSDANPAGSTCATGNPNPTGFVGTDPIYDIKRP